MTDLNTAKNGDDVFNETLFLFQLHQASGHLVRECGNAYAAAAIAEKSDASISNYLKLDHPATMPVLVAAKLEHHVGRPLVSRLLADVTAFDLTPRGDSGFDHIQIHKRALRITKELGEYSGALEIALDGDVTDNHNLANLSDEAYDVLKVAQQNYDLIVAEQARRRDEARTERGENVKDIK